MAELIEIRAKIRCAKGERPKLSDLKKAGGPLDWLPPTVKQLGEPEESGQAVDETVWTYCFRP